MTIPDILPFPAPQPGTIVDIVADILEYNEDPGYHLENAIEDAISIAFFDSATKAGFLRSTGLVRLKGVTLNASRIEPLE